MRFPDLFHVAASHPWSARVDRLCAGTRDGSAMRHAWIVSHGCRVRGTYHDGITRRDGTSPSSVRRDVFDLAAGRSRVVCPTADAWRRGTDPRRSVWPGRASVPPRSQSWHESPNRPAERLKEEGTCRRREDERKSTRDIARRLLRRLLRRRPGGWYVAESSRIAYLGRTRGDWTRRWSLGTRSFSRMFGRPAKTGQVRAAASWPDPRADPDSGTAGRRRPGSAWPGPRPASSAEARARAARRGL